MKTKILIIILGFIPFISFSQFTIQGKISSKKTNTVLQNANIVLENTYYASSSDKQGLYSISKIKKGNYMFKVSYVGFKTFEQEININKDTIIDIALEESTQLTEEVIISSTRVQDKSPTAYSNISNKEIKPINYGADLPFLLSNTPSLVITSDAGTGVGYTGLRIRGSDITRINVTVNGIPMNDPESQMVYFVNMPDFASSIDNIQVQRGIGTSTNGASAFGASLNIQTMKLNPLPYGEINSSYGSFNTWKRNALFGTGLIGGKWAFDGRISKITSDGYIDRAWSNLQSYYLSGGYYGENTIFKINVISGKERTYQAWYGVPQDSLKTNRTYNPYNYENQIDNYSQNHYQLLFSHQASDDLTMNFALHYTKGKGYYEEFKQDETFAKYKLPDVVNFFDTIIRIDTIISGNPITIIDTLHFNDTIKNTNIVRRRWLDNDFYGFTFSFDYNNHKNIQLILGGAWNTYSCDHFGEVIKADNMQLFTESHEYYRDNANKKDMNVYLKAIYNPTEKLGLFADLQYRRIDYTFEGYNEYLVNVQQSIGLNFFNPKAGISFDINNKNNVYLSYGMGNKEPNRDDYITSTPTTRPKTESMHDIEAGYRLKLNSLSCDLNAFYMYYKNQLVLTGEINQSSEYVRTNVPKSYRAGIEFSASWLPIRNLKVYADFTYSLNKIKSFTEFIDDWDTWTQKAIEHKNTDISFSPSIISSLQISYKPIKNISAILGGKYIGKQFMDNTSNSDRMLKPYVTTNFRLSYLMKTTVIKEIEVSAMVNNFINLKYESNGWTYSYYTGSELKTDNYYFPQSGINFMAGLNLRF